LLTGRVKAVANFISCGRGKEKGGTKGEGVISKAAIKGERV